MPDEYEGNTPESPIVIKFLAKVRKRGRNELTINIPTQHHDKASKLKGRDVKVTIEEIML